METHPETFPPDRRKDPKRQAEARVFDELRRSRLPGFAYYEWQRDQNAPQIDFAIWVPGVGRFGLDVKGGHYSLNGGTWFLETGDGPHEKESPLRKTWDAAMSLRDEVVHFLNYKTFFIAVLVFPDMEPDQAIIAKAKHSSKVHVLWGVDSLVGRLERIAASRDVYNPPDEDDIQREVHAVTDGQVIYEPPADRHPPRDDAPLPPGTSPFSTWTCSTSTRCPKGLRRP